MVIDNLLTDREGGWIGSVLAQPAACTVPLAFATMVIVSKLTQHRLPAAHLAVHGPAAHPRDGPARPGLTAPAPTVRRTSSTAWRSTCPSVECLRGNVALTSSTAATVTWITTSAGRVIPCPSDRLTRVLRPCTTPTPSTTPSTKSLYETAEFVELRRRFRKFVFPATVAFLLWYLLYVVMSNWATDFMSQKVVGNINVALIFGVLQFVSTFVLAWAYARYMNRQVDPLARQLDEKYGKEAMR